MNTEYLISQLNPEDRKTYVSYFSDFGKVSIALSSEGNKGACNEFNKLIRTYEDFAFSKNKIKAQLSPGMIGCLDNFVEALELNKEDCRK